MRRMVAVGFVQVSLLLAGGIEAQAFKAQPAAPLEKTQWTLTWVEGVKVGSTSRRPAYIELDPASHRLSGSGGCNRLMGTYLLDGDHLRLTGSARTMMACADGMDTEDKLVKALEEVREWKVSGERLELLDGSGNVVARFSEAGRTAVR
jgi:heat shock protein HslJ